MQVRSRLFPAAELLDVAGARLRRQTQFAKPLARGGRKAAEMERLLDLAADCVLDLARPQAVYRELSATPEDGGLRLDGKTHLAAAVLPEGLPEGATLSAYLLTLGYAQEEAFGKLGRDYMLHHFQTMLGREVLFALGRSAHRWIEDHSPGFRLRRIPVRMEDDRRLWDASAVQGLLGLFGAENPGVVVTEAGFFTPLNSTLGLMVAEPATTRRAVRPDAPLPGNDPPPPDPHD